MPPKKDNKNQNEKADPSGIAKNEAIFKLSFSVQTGQQPPECVVMFQWYASSEKLQRYDAGLIQNWTKKQSTPFDKQSQTLQYFRKHSTPFEQTMYLFIEIQDFCKNLSNNNFYVYFVNPQTSIVEDQLQLDYSSLLMIRTQPIQYEYKSSTIKVQNLDSFSLKLSADKQLLAEMYREYLNPMEVQVIGALDIPFDSSSKYLPTYVKYRFYDNTIVQTNCMVGQDKILWQHKHVFLMGLMNPIEIKQKIRSNYLKFEFHDRDQVQNNKLKQDIQLFDIAKAIAQEMEKQNPVQEDPKKKGAPKKQPEKKQVKKQTKKDSKKKDAKIADPILPKPVNTFKNNYGIAVYSLVEFLKPGVRAAKYKSPVIPRTMFEDFESRNIDLNTTARNQMQKIVFSNNYFDRDTTIVVGFTLSYPIGSFVQKHTIPKQKSATDNAITPAIVIDQILKKDVNNFERLVVFLPYKDKQNIQKLQNIFYQVNTKAFNLKNKRQITTHLLKQEEKGSVYLDYLSGVQLIDLQGRVYIIEGLKGKSIRKIYQALPKQQFNNDKQKILKNTKVLFTSRIYSDFNIQLKRIRFRPSLSQILLDPSIYIKSKVDEKICEDLNKMSNLRKICEDLQTVEGMSLWPNAQILVQIQRKYSQSLTFQDINGQKQQKKQKGSSLSQTKQLKNIDFIEKEGHKFKTADQFFNTKTQQPLNITKNNDTYGMDNTLKRTVHTKTFVRDNPMKQTYNFHLTTLPDNPNQPVYIYASQKHNWYEKQNQLLRQKLQNDKNKVYTMSKDYLSLSIDPYLIDLQAKKQLQMSKTKNYSPQKFSSLLVRTKQEKKKLAKQPGIEDIADMIKYPYHEQKARAEEMKKSQRDKPLNNGKDDFVKYLKKEDMFEYPQVLDVQKRARAEQQKQIKKQKLRRQQEQRSKMLGNSHIKIKKGYISDKVTDLDKFTNILEGSPVKKGIVDLHKTSKQKRPIENYEVSLYLKEKINNPGFNPLIRIDDQSKNVAGYQFNNYQKQQILTNTAIYKPLKQN